MKASVKRVRAGAKNDQAPEASLPEDFQLPPTKVADPTLVASRRQLIVATATRLFSERGFTKTSVLDLCRAASIPAGTLYLYIEKKEDLLVLMAGAMLGEIEAALREVADQYADPKEQLTASVAVLFREADRHRQVVKVTYWETHHLDRPTRESILNSERRATAQFRTIIESGIADGTFREVDARILAHNILVAAHMWALKHWAFKGDYGLTLEQYTEKQTEILMGALGRLP